MKKNKKTYVVSLGLPGFGDMPEENLGAGTRNQVSTKGLLQNIREHGLQIFVLEDLT